MFVEIITALGSLVATGLGIQAYNNTSLEKSPKTQQRKIIGEWLLTHPYEPTIQWLNGMRDYLISVNNPMSALEYQTLKSVIMTLDWLKSNPYPNDFWKTLKWLEDYRIFCITNNLIPQIQGVQNRDLYNKIRAAVGIFVAILIPVAAPALAVIIQKYMSKTLTVKDLEAISPCPTGQTKDANGNCVYNFGG